MRCQQEPCRLPLQIGEFLSSHWGRLELSVRHIAISYKHGGAGRRGGRAPRPAPIPATADAAFGISLFPSAARRDFEEGTP